MTNKQEYAARLAAFNATEKYKSELDFLFRLVAPNANEKIMDYGCGLGTAVKYFNDYSAAECFGYDKRNYRLLENGPAYNFRETYSFKFDKVFFLHSAAHIENIQDKLIQLREEFLKPEGKVYIITPNFGWLDLYGKGKDYVPDPTVIQHFSMVDLEILMHDCGYKIKTLGQFGAPFCGLNERLFLEAGV